LVSPDVGNFIN